MINENISGSLVNSAAYVYKNKDLLHYYNKKYFENIFGKSFKGTSSKIFLNLNISYIV